MAQPVHPMRNPPGNPLSLIEGEIEFVHSWGEVVRSQKSEVRSQNELCAI